MIAKQNGFVFSSLDDNISHKSQIKFIFESVSKNFVKSLYWRNLIRYRGVSPTPPHVQNKNGKKPSRRISRWQHPNIYKRFDDRYFAQKTCFNAMKNVNELILTCRKKKKTIAIPRPTFTHTKKKVTNKKLQKKVKQMSKKVSIKHRVVLNPFQLE